MDNKPRIIIIDDEVDLVINLRDIMKKKGFVVDTAYDGKSGIELCRKKTSDIAFIDIKLPDISGIDDARRIVKLSPGTECIFMTAYASLETATKAVKQNGVIAYEIKPLNIDNTLAFVNEVLKRRQMEAEKMKLSSELEKKNNELEQILYITSHDLRSPLRNIQGFSREIEYAYKDIYSALESGNIPHPLKEKLLAIIKQDIPETVKYIQSSVSKMDLLISGLLKLSRLESRELNIEQLDMNKLISGVAGTFEFLIKV